MHIILTHEQADFDALASMLGAYLLHDHAIPVLPRRMNRNVRAFLSLYGIDFPYVDPRDLSQEPIDSVILVDTQSMVSLKGMSTKTRVQVIDHHSLRDNLPQDWSILTDEVGATTTILIEALRERNGHLTPIQATLLLLGIYEDTGSLTYTRTNARDLQAAAYLLEQGASLQIANNFLNHPMSLAQQELYDRLRAGIKYFDIHGNTIILACGDAQDMDEELSTLAHKLRDLLDPDAIFLVVTTRGGVQIIGRSTNDNINVAEIVSAFGGGGHERAAASLVRDRDLEAVCSDLLRILPEFVRPSITVAQIMSSRPKLLSPDVSVEEAADSMRRYGYEGFPVVKDGKVVGLITRRSVDRALSHKYTKTVSSLMDSGNFTVKPGDAIEHVQRLVSETGWGQIPVIDPDSGEIIGIVTRTDLLKTLAPAPVIPGRLNLAGRLEAALHPERISLLKIIAAAAANQLVALYIVGGFVRDLILEKPGYDFDLVVEGDAIALAKSLAHEYGGHITSHLRFGTAKWNLEDVEIPGVLERTSISRTQSIDLVSARTEFYTHPTALPMVERGSIKLDLHRRDFTMNTLALRLDGAHYGELHDYWGGLEDLRSGQIRVLHSLSFVDDPTRILRAIRFEQRFGFNVEERTLELLLEARPLIERLSGDRIRHELNHIFGETAASYTMQRLHDLGCLSAIHPALLWDRWVENCFNLLQNPSREDMWQLDHYHSAQEIRRSLAYIFLCIRLVYADMQDVINRLKINVSLAREIKSANQLFQEKMIWHSSRPSQLTEFLDGYSPLAIYAVYLATTDPGIKANLFEYTNQWRKIKPSMDGNSLRRLNIPPGPSYRKILMDLRRGWLDGEIKSIEDEKKLLQKLISES